MDLWKTLLPVQGALSYDDKKLGRPADVAAGGPDPEKMDEVMLKRHRISRILYLHHFFDYPVSLGGSTIRNLGLRRMLGIGSSYLYSCLHKKQEHSLEDFMINRFGRKLYETFFRDYTEKVWGKSPRNIDVNWGRQRIKGVSLSGAIKDFIVRTTGKKDAHKTETAFIEQFLLLWSSIFVTVQPTFLRMTSSFIRSSIIII
jgi:protoporphyrinogen oxidase